MENTDDEALSWAGDESRMRGSGTWSVPKRAGSASPSSSPAEGARKRQVDGPGDNARSNPGPPTGAQERPGWQDTAALLATGVLAGVYLLFTAAWVITALRNPIAIVDPLGSFMFAFGLWLAAVAGPLTFTAVVVWRRGRGVMLRLLWLIIGAIVLIPWPYVSWVG